VVEPFTYLLIALKAAFLSSGGLASIPSLHQDLLIRHWATEKQFASSIAIGQIAPGPTGLWVVALGYVTAGVGGVLLMLVAITIPPLLVIPLSRVHGRTAHLPIVRGFARGLTVAAASTVPAVVIFRVLSVFHYSILSISIVAVSSLLLVVWRIPPLVVVAGSAALGAALLRS
jgi:chromate transporter